MTKMKLHFEDNLDYQLAAVESTVDLFRGQSICQTEFTVSQRAHPAGQMTLHGMEESTLGIGNRLRLLDNEILENLKTIQLHNGLLPTEELVSGDFTIEMETGTGKTYVYLRTIFELNKHYGFTKFMIVVPSVAIKEGTYKTLEITREHFENLYPMAKGYEYFLYDGAKPEKVREYATSTNIRIMVVTVGAINRQDVNTLYMETEKTGWERPVDLIKATRPVIIVDEPQSVDGGLGGQGRQALERMNSLCTLRYSATHVDEHHMIYQLDPVDAYERKLVKQIEVASLVVEGGQNKPYVKLLAVQRTGTFISATIEYMDDHGNLKNQSVRDGDNLEQVLGRIIYQDYRIGTITNGRANKSMEIMWPGGESQLHPGEEIGGLNSDEKKRLMIRRTIKEHLDKELRFAEMKLGVKVLSLFFIDRVEFYRGNADDGGKGKYAIMFEEEYRRFAERQEYKPLFEKIDLESNVGEVHEGYFAIDRQGSWQEPSRVANGNIGNNAPNRDNAERAYNLIMKDKEKLLSFDSKLKFIFSHSALREGWDNPNVFQICTLRDMGSERERRQTIGRGLRLCVNQQGQRLHGFDINTLTVIADESYERFAETLQSEIEKDTGIRFGIVEKHQFATVATTDGNGTPQPLGVDKSTRILDFLKEKDFVANNGKIKDSLRTALKEKTLELPKEFKEQAAEIEFILRKLAGKLDVKNANERVTISTNEKVLNDPEFKALWDRIKHKTTYRVAFDNEKLIKDCAEAIKEAINITAIRAQFRVADLNIDRGGIGTQSTRESDFVEITEDDIEWPDLLTDIQDKTQLTRKSIVEILIQSGRLEDFKRNPQEFIEIASEAISRTKRLALVDGISYHRIGDDFFYAQELFRQEELTGYLKNTLKTSKSVYERVIYDSVGTERKFAQELESNEAVKVYAKLPGWFTIPTPLGSYNPDWAVLVETDGENKLYFVVETKSSKWWDDLRHKEGAKIKCGEKHFKALSEEGVAENPAKYLKATNVANMLR